MDRHVIDALLRLMFDHVQGHPGRDLGRILEVLHHLVDRHGSDWYRGGVDNRLADGVDGAAGR